MEEVWKDIKGYKKLYQASSFGRIKSLGREIIGKFGNIIKIYPEIIMSQRFNKRGYKEVCLSKDGKGKKYSVHRFIAILFVLNPENKPQVNHKDCNKGNNRADNLEWTTASENVQHAYDNKLMRGLKGEKNPYSKLKPEQIVQIRKLNGLFTRKEIGKKFNVGSSIITDIINNKRWTHIK